MNFEEYQTLALVTENKALSQRDRLANGGLGLVGEAGEASEIIKKHLFHAHALDAERLGKELGDVLWYLAVLAHNAGLSLDDVAAKNIAKLKARYPEGFDALRSKERAE